MLVERVEDESFHRELVGARLERDRAVDRVERRLLLALEVEPAQGELAERVRILGVGRDRLEQEGLGLLVAPLLAQ